MSEDFARDLQHELSQLLRAPVQVDNMALLAGGASKQAWSVDAGTPMGMVQLLVRRAAGGAIYSETLTLEHEYQVLEAAFEEGVRVPKPYGYIPGLGRRDAFVMERLLRGETIGRRLVRRPELEQARRTLIGQMAEQAAKIHSIPRQRLPFLPGERAGGAAQHAVRQLERELDLAEEPHPAIELGLQWLRERMPESGETVVVHGDFRVGNLIVDEQGLVGVLDWEFSHVGSPVEDVGWPLVRAWRFGMDHLRLGGVGEAEPFLAWYNDSTGRQITPQELYYWEVLGNVRWAVGSLTQARRRLSGQERSVELAVLGRLAAEVEYEILHLIVRSN